MSNTFFLTVGIILAGIGLLLITAKILTYIRCTVPINATVVKLEIEYTFFRGVEHTHYRPALRYVVDDKSYTVAVTTRFTVSILLSVNTNPQVKRSAISRRSQSRMQKTPSVLP